MIGLLFILYISDEITINSDDDKSNFKFIKT